MDDQEDNAPAPELNGHEVAINPPLHLDALQQFTQAVANTVQLSGNKVNIVQIEVARLVSGVLIETLVAHLAATGVIDETAFQERVRDNLLASIQQSSPIIRPA